MRQVVSFRGREAEFDAETMEFLPVIDGSVRRNRSLRVEGIEIPALPFGEEGAATQGMLERLVLNVANLCNLDCVYCYAKGGDYGGPREKMSAEVGKRSFDRFFAQYDYIDTIQFFGGEPFLNWRVIDEICGHVKRAAEVQERHQPTFMVITNGTVMTDEVIDMIARHDIKITVSLDGPPKVNDLLRLSRSPGVGVGKLVEESVARLRERTGQPIQLEGVFTNQHVKNRCSVVEVLEYAVDKLGIGVVHLPINSIATSDRHDPQAIRREDMDWVLASYEDATAYSLRSLATKPVNKIGVLSTAYSIYTTLLQPSPAIGEFICPAGKGTIAVDSNGDVYPCFMFYRQEHYRWGSIHDASQPLVQLGAQRSFLDAIRPAAIPALGSSWAKKFVRGCAGSNFFKNGHHGTITPDEVAFIETMVRAAVVELAHLSEDEDLYNYLPAAMHMFTGYLSAPAS